MAVSDGVWGAAWAPSGDGRVEWGEGGGPAPPADSGEALCGRGAGTGLTSSDASAAFGEEAATAAGEARADATGDISGAALSADVAAATTGVTMATVADAAGRGDPAPSGWGVGILNLILRVGVPGRRSVGTAAGGGMASGVGRAPLPLLLRAADTAPGVGV